MPSDVEGQFYVKEAELKAKLLEQADRLAQKNGYPSLKGMEALCRYFADKYGWLPEQTKRLTTEEISLLLENTE